MRQLKDLVTVNKRFRKSVNLQLDLGDFDRINDYIPTKSSALILKRYLKIVQGQAAERANLLIGPFGKGKSHLLLVLLSILKGRSELLEPLLTKLKQVDREAFREIETVWAQNRPYLPVLVTAGENGLSQSLIQALRESLLRENILDIAPESYYSEAEKTIAGWKENFPETFQRLERLLMQRGRNLPELMRMLAGQKKEAMQLFREVYPQLTSGSRFEPMICQEALQVYREVNRRLAVEYGYAGIFIVFDEFSKYMEGCGREQFSNDMKALQDLCELAGYTGGENLFLTLVVHKSIHEYAKGIDKAQRNAFQGVEGRLKEIRFVVTNQNSYELIADTLIKKEPEFQHEFQQIRKEDAYSSMISDSYELTCFHTLFEPEDYQNVLIYGCFPLTPVCAYALLHLSEKSAQNERTIFTFLTNEESGSLPRMIEDGFAGYIGADKVYDYFKGLFREAQDLPQIHNEWLKADYALGRVQKEAEQKIIKAMAVIRMIHREDELAAQDGPLRLSLGMEKTEYEKAMESLICQGIVIYRSSLSTYAFKNNVGVDVETEIQKAISAQPALFPVCEAAAEVSELEYVLPKQYNQNFAMTRYFRYVFLTADEFLALEKSEYLFEREFCDGMILALIGSRIISAEVIRKHLTALGEERIVVLVPKRPFGQLANLKKLAAVKALKSDETFVEDNKVLVQELSLYEEDIAFEINAGLEQDFLPQLGGSKILHLEGEWTDIRTAGDFNRHLSRILDRYFAFAPRVNHELLNIQNVTGQYLRARNRVIDAILKEEDMSQYRTATSPEAMVYRAAFVRTGIVSGEFDPDPGCVRIFEEIDQYFKQCSENRQPFSLLYLRLTGRDYGVRKGILPLFLARRFAAAEETPVIYLGKKELDITADTLNHVNQFPENYELYIEPESAKKSEYLNCLEELFCGLRKGSMTKQSRLKSITESMQKWYRGLPQFAMVTRNFPEDLLHGILALRSELKRAEPNPRELLLERIPGRIAEGELQTTVIRLRIIKGELDGCLMQQKYRTAAKVKRIFGAKSTDSLRGCLKEWYTAQNQAAKSYVASSTAGAFLSFLEGLTTFEEGEILEELSRKILDVYAEDWNDETEERLEQILTGVKAEVEGMQKQNPDDSGLCRIILQDGTGKKLEKFYDAGGNDSTAAYLKNMISETLEDFGDTLENGQKVAVLVSALTELLQ